MLCHRNDFVIPCHIHIQAGDDRRRNIVISQIHDFHAILLSQHGEQFVLSDSAELNQSIHDIQIAVLGFQSFLTGLADLLIGDHSIFFKEGQDIFRIPCQNKTPLNKFTLRFYYIGKSNPAQHFCQVNILIFKQKNTIFSLLLCKVPEIRYFTALDFS